MFGRLHWGGVLGIDVLDQVGTLLHISSLIEVGMTL